MEIKEVTNKEVWENFVSKFEDKTFLSSWDWGIVQKNLGNKIFYLGVFKDKEIIAVALVIKVVSKRAKFLLIQHGPLIKKSENFKEVFSILIREIKKIAKREKCSFLRIVPLFLKNWESEKFLKNFGFRKSPMHASAYESTWRLDITSSEEELMSNMRKTTRYLIRKSLKNIDVKIRKSLELKDIYICQKIMEETAKKQRFVPFSFEFTKTEFEVFANNNQVLLFIAEYKKEPVAAALVIFWQGIGFYHQAGSLPEYNKLSLPYLIQWEAIKEAKKRGCKVYDFWGFIDPFENPKHPWAGPTLFKMGFGGYKKEYIGTYDLVFSPLYWVNFLVEIIRKLKRRLY